MTSGYPQTGSILNLGDSFGTNTTDTAISTNIFITVRTAKLVVTSWCSSIYGNF